MGITPMIWKMIFKDFLSDLLGGGGVTTISIPFITDATDIAKLFGALGGAVLIVISIRIKLALYREIKKRQREEQEFIEKNKK